MPLIPIGPWVPTDIFLSKEQKETVHGDAEYDTVGDQILDATFQRPAELGLGSEDDVDLPLGDLRSPTGDPDFMGEDRTFGSPDFANQFQFGGFNLVDDIPWGPLVVGIVGLIIVVTLVRSVAMGFGQGLAS